MQHADRDEPPETSKRWTTLAFKLSFVLVSAGVAVWISNLIRAGQEKFEQVNAPIESMMPRDRGLAATPVGADRTLLIIRISRVGPEGGRKPGFVLRLNDSEPAYALPAGWSGDEYESKARRAAYDAVFAELQLAVREQAAQFDVPMGKVRGEITSALPDGSSAPTGIVLSALNAFLAAGMCDIVYIDDAAPAALAVSEGGG